MAISLMVRKEADTMLTTPMEVLTQYPVRKSKQQKKAFRDAVQSYAKKLGYESSIEKGSYGVHNVIIGDPEKAKYLITAHYDTCARMVVPNLVTPCNIPFFILYQIFVVLLILVPAILAGVLLGFLSQNADFAGTAAMAVYWVLLVVMMFGPANPSNANDNTSGVVTLLETMRTLPENQRHKVCFVLFDLEEAGMLGSSAYRKAHKNATNTQLVLNMDCVGDGDHLLIFPNKKLRKDKKKLTSLYKACGYFGKKSLLVHEKGLFVYPSDQANFPYGAAIAACSKRKGLGYYYSRIHTPKDTVLDETNVNLLRAALTTLICCDAAQ